MRVIDLGIGSRTVKRVTVEEGEVVEHLVVPNNHDPLTVCDELLSGQRADRVVATGYGCHLLSEHREAETLTEIRAVWPWVHDGCAQVPGRCSTSAARTPRWCRSMPKARWPSSR